jgi:MFS family permease
VVLGSVFWGTLSDRVGVRRLYLLLLLLDAVFFFLSAIAESALELLIWRAGAGFCSLMPLAASWISAATPPEKQMKAFTLLTVFILLGFISGSVLGGLLGSVQSGVGVGDGGWFVAVAASSACCIIVFLIILFASDPPPPATDGEQPVRSGVKEAVLNVEFFAATFACFVGSQEGGFVVVVIGMIFIQPEPAGFGYTPADMGACNGSICAALIFGSVVLEQHITRRTHPQHRLVLLGIIIVTMEVIIVSILLSWDLGGLWTNGDKLFMTLLALVFVPQCLVFPTSMSIGSAMAAKGTNVAGPPHPPSPRPILSSGPSDINSWNSPWLRYDPYGGYGATSADKFRV